MKKTISLLVAVAFAACMQAQVIYDYLKGADDYFAKGDYYSAANYYEKYLGKGGKNAKLKNTDGYTPYSNQKAPGKRRKGAVSSKEQALYNLAECYRKLHYYEKAEPLYTEVLALPSKGQFPYARYWYAMTLRSLGKYQEAEAAMKQFSTEYTAADSYKTNADKEIKNLAYIQKQLKREDLKLYKVGKLAGEVPDTGAAYAPLIFKDDFYFTSTKSEKGAPKLQEHNNRVYQAAYKEGNISGVKKVEVPESDDIQQGVVAFSRDGNIMYVTRWANKDGKKLAVLCRSIRGKNNSWSTPEVITSGINAEGYSSQQPFVMPDGKYLLFASDMPGGQGGFDLWMAPIDVNGREGKPVNMGKVLNTVGDEQAPYYHEASKTLVFSSNGMVGMGGYDFFYSKGYIKDWTAPFNFGHPVNSIKDDLYFVSKGGPKNILDDVVISSDRNNVCCLELLTLHKDRLPKKLKGVVVSCEDKKPLSGVAVTVLDTINNKTVGEFTTDSSGGYSLTLDEYRPLKVRAMFSGYYMDSLNFKGPSDEEELQFNITDICLVPFPKDNPFIMKNIFYDFDSVNFQPASTPELDRLVALMKSDPLVNIEIGSHTDNKGTPEYNEKLSSGRAKAVVAYLSQSGIDKRRLSYKGYGETVPIASNENADGTDNPEGRQLNRRTEVKILNQKPIQRP
jgi:OOP family OmpA-OmpF porin